MLIKIRIDYLLMYLLFGPRWREKIWISKKDKRELEDQILISSTPVLTEKWNLKPVKIDIESEYACFNPSIVKTSGGYQLIARSTNVINLNDGTYQYLSIPHVTKNYLLFLNDNFEITDKKILNNNLNEELSLKVQYGIDDIRIFKWAEQYWVCGAVPYLSKGSEDVGSKQIFCRLNGDELVDHKLIDSPYNRKVEKNWVPVINNEELSFACGLAPLDLMHYKNGELLHHKQKIKDAQDFSIRGGTPFINWKNVLLGIVHSAHIHHKGKRYYTHHFVTLNSKLEMLEISEPFFIQRKGIEFASGLELDDGGVVLSYGVADRRCRVVRIPDSIIEKYITA